MTIPLCQQCGKKLYMSYGVRGYMAERDRRYHYHAFKSQEEHDAHEIPENAYDIRRGTPNDNTWSKHWIVNYETPQQPRDGLFHSRHCWEEWHCNHRDDIERVIRSRGEWRS